MNITNDQNKKVLIIAYYFPPLGMGGVQRVSKFVKYLSSFGWEPIVLTVKDIEYFSRDDSLLQELPEGIKIKRTGSLDPLRIIFLFKKLFQRKKSYGKKTRDPDPACGGTSRVAQRNSKKKKAIYHFSTMLRFINLFSFPDNKIGWFPFALLKGIKLCREEKIDLLFSTSPPLTCHLAGYFLKKFTGIKWVADYRDSFINNQDGKAVASFKKFFLKRLQKLFLKNGNGFIGVNQRIIEELKEIYPEAKKIEVITNGYDQEDFDCKVEKRKDIFQIIYFGTFSPDCPAEPFFKALHNLLHQGKLSKYKIKFIVVGLSIGIDIEGLIERYELKEITELKGYLPHKKGVSELLKADLALLVVSESAPVITTGKIYEYLGAQIPVLAIVPQNGEAGKLIELLSAGKVVSPENISGIEEAILYFYREFENGKPFLKADPEKLKKYERKYLTSKLAQLFEAEVKE
jgi:glycosyltransferase involved in cell wall biosynthesis